MENTTATTTEVLQKPVDTKPQDTSTPKDVAKPTEEKTATVTSDDIKTEPNAPVENVEKNYTLKVDGKELKVTLEEALKLAQKGMGAEKKFNEAYKIRQQAENFVKLLKENPRQLLQHPSINYDIKRMAEEILLEEIEKEKMTPDQRQAMETKSNLEKLQEENKRLKQEQENERMQRLVAQYNQELDIEISSALKNSSLPKTPSTVKRVAYYLDQALRNGRKDVKASDVIEYVRKDYLSDISELFGNSEGDILLQLLGEPVLKKIRESELKKLNIKPPATNSNPVKSDVQDKKTQMLTKDEWEADLIKRFGR